VPELSVLDGDKGEVAYSHKGIAVTKTMQSTTNPHVYAVGDIAATPYKLSSVADLEGRVAAANIRGETRAMGYDLVPTAIFTLPPLASVGLSEEKAKAQGLQYRIHEGETSHWPSSRRIGESHGYYRLIIDEETDRILGAHLLRHNSPEAVNMLALAMKAGWRASDLAQEPWAYPTYTSDLHYMM